MILYSIVLLRLESFSVSATDGRSLIIIIVLPIVLPITLVIIIYSVYKIKSRTNEDEIGPKSHTNKNPDNFLQDQDNGRAINNDTNQPGQRNDNRIYDHLNHRGLQNQNDGQAINNDTNQPGQRNGDRIYDHLNHHGLQNQDNGQAINNDTNQPGKRDDDHNGYDHLNHRPYLYANTAI